MALISQVQIEGFRCFRTLRVDGLKRINVIVGVNNSGKSSLLEAIGLLVSLGSPLFVLDALKGRGQMYTEQNSGRELLGDARELFFGRTEGGPATSAAVSSPEEQVTLSLRPSVLEIGSHSDQYRIALVGPRSGISEAAIRKAVEPYEDSVATGLGPLSYLSSSSARPEELQNLWSLIAGTEREDLVLSALRALDPTIERVISAPSASPPVGFDGWYLRRFENPNREAFSGQGEGLKRALSLSLAMASVAGGTLLVDEVENGMHYSVMPAIWRLLVESAEKLDVQVFMTSHSRDLIDAFSDAELEAGRAFDVAFFRLEHGRDQALRISRDVVATLAHTRHDIR